MRMCVPVLCLHLNKPVDRFSAVLAVFYHRLLSIKKGGQLSMFKVLDEPLLWTRVYPLTLHVLPLISSLPFSPLPRSFRVQTQPSLRPTLSLPLFVFFPPFGLQTEMMIFPTACHSSCFSRH